VAIHQKVSGLPRVGKKKKKLVLVAYAISFFAVCTLFFLTVSCVSNLLGTGGLRTLLVPKITYLTECLKKQKRLIAHPISTKMSLKNKQKMLCA
jgi:hypothetical protein